MTELRTRTNRLRRSVRVSQAGDRPLRPGDSPARPGGSTGPVLRPAEHQPFTAQTPGQTQQTQTRSRLSAGASGQSPHNDSDLLQDIVWDTTSPSPQRLGKRGRRVAAGAVNISDIVSRIAPESGRPRVLEPALQQWIGDSATIPCTPELQPPKPKRRSPRPNAVDDLLRLAKQFDFNMLHETSPDRELDQDLDLHQDLPRPGNPAQDAAPDWASDEDLDYLFDSSTQSLSGAFSQNLPTPNPGLPTEHRANPGLPSEHRANPGLPSEHREHRANPGLPTEHRANPGLPTEHRANPGLLTEHRANPGLPTEHRPSLGLKKSEKSVCDEHDKPFSSGFSKSFIRTEPKAVDRFTSNPSSIKPQCLAKSEQNLTKQFKFKSNTSRYAETLPENRTPASASAQGPVQDMDEDWDDDALMDDSLLMELTQNPPGLTSPKCTSTQRDGEKPGKTRHTFALTANRDFYRNLNMKEDASFNFDFSEDMKDAATSKSLEWSRQPTDSTLGPKFSSPNGLLKNSEGFHNSAINLRTKAQQSFGSDVVQTGLNSKVGQNSSAATGFRANDSTRQTLASVSGFVTKAEKLLTKDTQSITSSTKGVMFGNPDAQHSFGADVTSRGLCSNMGQNVGARFQIFPSSSSETQNVQNAEGFSRSKGNSGQGAVCGSLSKAGEDFLDDDLDSFFSSEPQWDDDDDDLLCELCLDLETQIQSSANHMQGAGPTASSANHKQKTTQTLSSASHTQRAEPTLSSANPTQRAWSRIEAPAQSKAPDDFTFKKPEPPSGKPVPSSGKPVPSSGRPVPPSGRPVPPSGKPVPSSGRPAPSSETQVGGKCSAAEIELKKQQALERRRQRLQAQQPISSQRHTQQPISSQRHTQQPISSLRAPT